MNELDACRKGFSVASEALATALAMQLALAALGTLGIVLLAA